MSRLFTLFEAAGGGVNERIEQELNKVYKNISDPNTEAIKKRELNIKVTFSPTETRDTVPISITVTSKLQPTKTLRTCIFVDTDGSGNVAAAELGKNEMPGQVDIEENEKVRKIK